MFYSIIVIPTLMNDYFIFISSFSSVSQTLRIFFRYEVFGVVYIYLQYIYNLLSLNTKEVFCYKIIFPYDLVLHSLYYSFCILYHRHFVLRTSAKIVDIIEKVYVNWTPNRRLYNLLNYNFHNIIGNSFIHELKRYVK